MPDMSPTAEAAVFQQLLTDVSDLAAITTIVDADNIYLKAVASIEGITNRFAVQIVPGAGRIIDGMSGSAMVEQTFDIFTFWQSSLDQTPEDSVRLAGVSGGANGMMVLRDAIRGNGSATSPTGLIHYVPQDGLDDMTTPVVLVNFSAASVNPFDANWIQVSDTFRFRWSPYAYV